MKKILLTLLALCAVLSLCFTLAACNSGNENKDDEGPEAPQAPQNYSVHIKTAGGLAISGVTVDLYLDGDLTAHKTTNAKGSAVFENLEVSSEYTVELSGVPDGYNVQSSYSFGNKSELSILLSSAPIPTTDITGVNYQLGDIIHDFTVTDYNGNEINLSALLEEKRAVVLNFWYINCSWCVKEFPSMNEAYNKVNTDSAPDNDIEILAINIYMESNSSLAAFAEENGLSIPLVRDTANLRTPFKITAAPTTVIVDRYGMIALIESNATIGAQYWENAFAYFTADDYKQGLFHSIEGFTEE